MSQVSEALQGYMEKTEPWGDQERPAPRDPPALQERRETQERMGLRALTDPQGPLELQAREASWAFQGSEESGA